MTPEQQIATWINDHDRRLGDLERKAAARPTRVGANVAKTSQSIPNNTYTAISFDLESYDSHGFITVPGGTLTVPSGCAGIYAIVARVVLTTPCAGQIEMVVGGTPYDASYTSGLTSPSITVTLPLAVGDTVGLFMTQGSGGANSVSVRLQMYRLAF